MKVHDKVEDLLPKRAKELYQLDERYILEVNRTIKDTHDFFTKKNWNIPRLLQELKIMMDAYDGKRERLKKITALDLELPESTTKITSFDNGDEPAKEETDAPEKEEFRFG